MHYSLLETLTPHKYNFIWSLEKEAFTKTDLLRYLIDELQTIPHAYIP